MDIHAPHEPVRGWKDFAIHIAVVTVGILIALALEGVRELILDHRLVHEARVNFTRELSIDRDHASRELPAMRANTADLERLVAEVQSGKSDDGAIAKRLLADRNPFYFFALSSWQTALSTGALQHMPPEEVEQYAGAAEIIRVYSGLQADALREENEAGTYFAAHPHPSAGEQREGLQHLLLLARADRTLVFVGRQLDAQIDEAYSAAAR